MNDNMQKTIFDAICADIDEIFLVDITTEKVRIVRHDRDIPGMQECLSGDFIYSEAIQTYIENNVYEEDQEKFRRYTELSSVCNMLKNEESINVFYRVNRDSDIHYLRLKCARIGSADSFNEIVYTFVGEDFETGQIQMIRSLETDELTGIYTKQAFYRYAAEFRAQNPDKDFDLLVADVENFKLINRLYGRNMGDKVLKYLAESYAEAAEGGIIGRYGGDQFAVFMPSLSERDINYFYSCAEKFKDDAPVPYLTVRYGVYRNVKKADSIEDMCDKAMLAIQSKKNFHDDPICFYDDEVIKNDLRSKMFESNFERGIAENQFVVWCQPKFNTGKKVMTSAEALVRWKDDKGNFISPGEFIPVFESDGLIAKLDEYVFLHVCKCQKQLLEEGKEPLPISVNMSRITLFTPGIVDRYKEIIEGCNIPKRLVPIEITESATNENEQILKFVDSLKSAGFVLHMDDFGSGYSSLSNLSSLKFDAVKIDKSLTDGIGTPRGEEVIRHIVGIAHFFMMEVVAEGVEQRVQYSFLKKLGCDTIQGYYFCKPVPVEEFVRMCETQPKISGGVSVSQKADENSTYSNPYEAYDEVNEGKIGLFTRISEFVTRQIKGEKNDTYRANVFTIKCMMISLVVLFICWLLDVLGVFIVDIHIMNISMMFGLVICAITFLYAKFFGVDRIASRYVTMVAMVAMYSTIFMEMSYHTTLVMIFPLICSMLYFDRRVTIFTYIVTCIGYAFAVMVGFRIGLCDSNMLLLTYTNSAFHSAQLLAGDFSINDSNFLVFLFFVFPRWLLVMAIMPLLYQVANDVQFRTTREAKIRHLAELDGLTGVSNRYKYVQAINNYYPGCNTVGILYFDINNLKDTNDNMGHEIGDKLICALSEELLKFESDICKSYRIGGDEFVMILENEEVNHIDNYIKGIKATIEGKEVDNGVTLSVAIGKAVGSGKDIENIINNADEEMYHAKQKMKEETT